MTAALGTELCLEPAGAIRLAIRATSRVVELAMPALVDSCAATVSVCISSSPPPA